MDMVHNARWGGLICVGGPDETGEPSVYMYDTYLSPNEGTGLLTCPQDVPGCQQTRPHLPASPMPDRWLDRARILPRPLTLGGTVPFRFVHPPWSFASADSHSGGEDADAADFAVHAQRIMEGTSADRCSEPPNDSRQNIADTLTGTTPSPSCNPPPLEGTQLATLYLRLLSSPLALTRLYGLQLQRCVLGP